MTTFIDLWPGEASIHADAIYAIEALNEADRADHIKHSEPRLHAYIEKALTVVYTVAVPGRVYSTLSYRELRNRLRKAGRTFI